MKRKEKDLDLETISEEISEYIQRKVDRTKYDDTKWKEHYDTVIEELKSEINNTKEVIASYSEENLTINRIEQEGYLRGLISMVNQFERWLPK